MSREERIGSARLILGDCREVMPTLDVIGSIVTDPPYGMNYRSGHNSRSGAHNLARKDGNFKPTIGDQVPFDPAFLLEYGCPTLLWGANYFASGLPTGGRWLVWNKLCGKTPLPSGSDAEIAWCSEKGPTRIFDHLWRGIMRAGEENIVHSAKHHSHQKPVALMAWCLSFVGGEPVVDPFMGSGSTGVAALRCNRPFIGIECDENHFQTAVSRLKKEHAEAKQRARQGHLFGAAS